jgi:uncharacterized repeat protein (TIGR02543 family)
MLIRSKFKALLPTFLMLIAFSLMTAFSANAGVITYKYDELNRLHSAEYPGALSILYEYDEIGNMLSKTVTGNQNVVSFTADSSGSLTGSTSQTVQYNNSTTPVTAVPNDGHYFVNWTGSGGFATTASNPLVVDHVIAPQTISANFGIYQYPVTFRAASNGSLTGATAQTIEYGGSSTAVQAVPTIGYHFANWTGPGAFVLSTTNPLVVNNVGTAQDITANFAIDQIPVNFTAGTNGSLTGTSSQTINYNGSTTAVTANPATGYHFVNWTGTGGFVTTTSNPLVVNNVTTAQTITANFAINQYQVTITAGANGTLVQGVASQTVNYNGSTTSIIAAANTGYHFVNWTCPGKTFSSGNILIVNNVTEAMTITANFAIDQYPVTFTAGPNGSLTGATSQLITNNGSTTAVTAVPAPGYYLVSWTGDGFATTASNPLVLNNVTSGQSITANFAIYQYPVNFSAMNCNLSGNLSQNVNYGGSATAVTATPIANYHFVGWAFTPGYITTSTNPLVVSNITAPQSITASCAINQFSVYFNAGPNGTLAGQTSQVVNAGRGTTAVSAYPAANYHFVNWTGTGGFVTTTTNPLNVYPTTDQSITANFAIDQYPVTFTSGGNGSLTGATSQNVIVNNSTTAVTAVPAPGYHFVNWTGTGGFVTTSSNPLTVYVTAAQNITANFGQQDVTLYSGNWTVPAGVTAVKLMVSGGGGGGGGCGPLNGENGPEVSWGNGGNGGVTRVTRSSTMGVIASAAGGGGGQGSFTWWDDSYFTYNDSNGSDGNNGSPYDFGAEGGWGNWAYGLGGGNGGYGGLTTGIFTVTPGETLIVNYGIGGHLGKGYGGNADGGEGGHGYVTVIW